VTIRGIAAVYLIFVLLPVVAAIILIVVAARKRKHLERMQNPEFARSRKPKQPGRISRFFTVRK